MVAWECTLQTLGWLGEGKEAAVNTVTLSGRADEGRAGKKRACLWALRTKVCFCDCSGQWPFNVLGRFSLTITPNKKDNETTSRIKRFETIPLSGSHTGPISTSTSFSYTEPPSFSHGRTNNAESRRDKCGIENLIILCGHHKQHHTQWQILPQPQLGCSCARTPHRFLV